MITVDGRNADAKARLLREVDGSREPWTVRTEQALSGRDLFVARLELRDLRGWATVECSGHRAAGGYEYMVSVFDFAGDLRRGPSPFSFPSHALFWAHTWLLEAR